MNYEEVLLEQYKQVREYLKKLVNTDDLLDVNFYKLELKHKIDYICKIKERLIKNAKQ